MKLTVSGKRVSVEADRSAPLLWVLRVNFGLTGTKFGCGMTQCGFKMAPRAPNNPGFTMAGQFALAIPNYRLLVR